MTRLQTDYRSFDPKHVQVSILVFFDIEYLQLIKNSGCATKQIILLAETGRKLIDKRKDGWSITKLVCHMR